MSAFHRDRYNTLNGKRSSLLIIVCVWADAVGLEGECSKNFVFVFVFCVCHPSCTRNIFVSIKLMRFNQPQAKICFKSDLNRTLIHFFDPLSAV